MKKLVIAQYIAIVATCMTVIGFLLNLATHTSFSASMFATGMKKILKHDLLGS